jgi:hypothetical protein
MSYTCKWCDCKTIIIDNICCRCSGNLKIEAPPVFYIFHKNKIPLSGLTLNQMDLILDNKDKRSSQYKYFLKVPHKPRCPVLRANGWERVERGNMRMYNNELCTCGLYDILSRLEEILEPKGKE